MLPGPYRIFGVHCGYDCVVIHVCWILGCWLVPGQLLLQDRLIVEVIFKQSMEMFDIEEGPTDLDIYQACTRMVSWRLCASHNKQGSLMAVTIFGYAVGVSWPSYLPR